MSKSITTNEKELKLTLSMASTILGSLRSSYKNYEKKRQHAVNKNRPELIEKNQGHIEKLEPIIEWFAAAESELSRSQWE